MSNSVDPDETAHYSNSVDPGETAHEVKELRKAFLIKYRS